MKFLSPIYSPPWSQNSSPFWDQAHSTFPKLYPSVSPAMCTTGFPIQSELGVNRLFSLAAWGNLLSPCSCFFPVFFIPFPGSVSIIIFWLSAPLHFSDAKAMLRTFFPSARANSQRTRSCLVHCGHSGEVGRRLGTLRNQNYFSTMFASFNHGHVLKDQSPSHPTGSPNLAL